MQAVSPCDSENFPQFKPCVTPANTTARASARTYFYATEKKCDDVMRNFISCVEMAGIMVTLSLKIVISFVFIISIVIILNLLP